METVNQGMDETVNQDERTFTQDEINTIIGTRMKEFRAKYADYDELKEKAAKLDEIEQANKTELEKAKELASSLMAEVDALKTENQRRTMREAIAKETGVPASLLTADSEDDCREQAKAIMDFAKPAKYPKVRDAGEVIVTGKKENRDLFADWLNNNSKGD